MEALPHFRKRDGGHKEMSGILGITPGDESGIGPGLFRLAYGVRVEHEIHSRDGLTKSSGMRGGSHSVVSRTAFSHAFNFSSRCRAVVFRRLGGER